VSAGGLVHWDDVQAHPDDEGHFAATWRFLGREGGAGSWTVNRIDLVPNRWSTPAHVEDEEIFYVLRGSGLSWQDGKVYEVREGDCIVHRAGREAHTLRAGDDGLDVLVFGRRGYDGHATLPRAGVTWLGRSWVQSGEGGHPWEQELAAGEPEVGDPGERPTNIVNVDTLEPDDEGDRAVATEAGAMQAGMHHRTLGPGVAAVPAHCHSAEEEMFVMLDGTATLELIPSPRAASFGIEEEQHELRAGHVVCRPGGTRVSHFFRGGDEGAVMLVWGNKDPNDIAYYPRSNKINFRGVGLIARLDNLEYSDGEPEFGGEAL
jgi:uncharacterized cupin superfamily protein